ncbi:MAG: plastocyanin/azurin family copper-binding protein [Acidobacteriota bacterium]
MLQALGVHAGRRLVPRLCRDRRRVCLSALVGLVLLGLAGVAPAAEHTIVTNGTTFVPADLTIQAGDTVIWRNEDGGSHNVVSDDALFTSGPPSTDLWEFRYTFSKGGVYGYHCEVHQAAGMTGTITVEGLFGDGFEIGDQGAWDDTVPVRADCTCYFSSDCVAGSSCDYGPGGFSTEDICTWVDGKPDGVPGAGCNLPHNGPWGGEICDGVCAPSAQGSSLGIEDAKRLAEGTRLWAEAILGPSMAGGGPLDPIATQRARQIPYERADAADHLGRYVADLLVSSGTPGFYKHFCYHEQHPDSPDPAIWVDLSNAPCAAALAGLTIDAALAEMARPGDGLAMARELPSSCDAWPESVGASCGLLDAPDCLGQRIRDFVDFVTTARAGDLAGLDAALRVAP